jgi:serine/threonine-protein kinase
MICPACKAENGEDAEACFTCGKALFALTQGISLAGRYEILSPLGRGGMGMVYKAHDLVLDETVAIKVLRSEIAREPEMAKRFRSEIKLARRVSHRNVCRIHEYGEDAGVRFISMEFIDGVTLKDRLQGRPASVEEGLGIGLQVARGLQAVHDHGIIHRDFKTSNIMIDAKGVVRLMDFGIAKAAGSETSSASGTGHAIGTPEYMSPEQARGVSVDLRSDIYSLGCVLFEIFTGRVPFRGETPVATMFKQIHDSFPASDIAKLPDPLVPVLRRALAKSPEDRFASVAELSVALRAARDALGVSVSVGGGPEPETATIHRQRRQSRNYKLPGWALWAGIAALAVAVVGLLDHATQTRLQAPEPPSATNVAPSAPPPSATPATLDPGGTAASTPSGAPPKARREPRLTPPPLATRPTTFLPAPPTQVAVPPTTTAPAEAGLLFLMIVPEAEVVLDGRSLGVLASRQVRLAPGAHFVRVLHPDYEPLQRRITVREGVEAKLVLDLAEKGIRRRP